MQSTINRRDFLKSAGAAAATFTILRTGSARTYAANEKLSIACIGAGGRGAINIRDTRSENPVALCDVADKMLFTNHESANPFLRRDYRHGWAASDR